MLTVALQSGSNGNSFYVEADGVKLLIDAGITGMQIERKLDELGRDVRDIDAVLITHDHSDHVKYAGVLQRKYGLPLFVTAKTFEAARRKTDLGKLHDVHHFEAGQSIQLGSVSVETIPTPHDCVDGVVFVVTSDSKRLGIFTDLGSPFGMLTEVIASLDAVFLESNYDPYMLAHGPSPPHLKQRIRGPGGHISNTESAELLLSAGGRLKWACLSHLSENNNDPDLALETHRSIVTQDLVLHLAGRNTSTPMFEV